MVKEKRKYFMNCSKYFSNIIELVISNMEKLLMVIFSEDLLFLILDFGESVEHKMRFQY